MKPKSIVVACVAALTLTSVASAEETPAVTKAVEDVRAELGDKFIVTVESDILVVASDLHRKFHARTAKDLRRVYRAVYNEYLDTHPTEPILVYLFATRKGYDAYCKRQYGSVSDTPFGFYVSSERKMVMNIGTGGGTLRHELIHPLIEADFPKVPAWFNESFASIFEGAYHARGNTMRGMNNWRLPGLKKYLAQGGELRLRELMSTDTNTFYEEWGGLGYAIGRHLLIYLERKGLLAEYYEAFRAGVATDPTGIKTMERVTGQTLEELETNYLKWLKRARKDS